MSKLLNTELVRSQNGSESKSIGSNLKIWQLALLIGVPSSVIAYLIYRNMYGKKNVTKKVAEVAKKSLNEQTSTSSTNETTPKKDTTPKTPLEQAVDIKNQGNKFFQQGKFEEAAKCYSEAIGLCPVSDKRELPKFYQNRAAAYENMKQYEKVIEDCSAALTCDPSYTKALLRRAKAYENIDKLQEAFEDLTALCILDKFSSTAMASADKMVRKIGERMASEKFKNRKGLPISQHFVNNFYIGLNKDITFKNQAFAETVKNSDSIDMQNALVNFDSGDFTKCIEDCSKEIDNDGKFKLEAKNLRGSLYMLKCQYKEAKQDFDSILNNDEASNRLKSNTLIKLTALYLQNGEEDEAFRSYDRAVEIDSENEDIYCNRAQVYAMKGRFQECFNDFDKCLQINSNHKIARLQKAFFEFRHFYAQLSMYKQATESANAQSAILNSKELKEETTKLEAILTQYSDVPETFNLYAQILSEQENYEKAETYYELALKKDPMNAALLCQRALNTMTWKNDFEEPIVMLNKAIEIDNTCEFAYETLATIEIQRGNLERAVDLFQSAIELTRSEESMTNLCSMLVGAQTQFKVLTSLAKNGLAADIMKPMRM